MKTILTPKIKAELKRLSANLPNTPVLNDKGGPVTRVISRTGASILASSFKKKDEHGEPIDPLKNYSMKVFVWVDHYKELCKAYEDGGQEAATKYCEPYMNKEPQNL